MMLEKSIERLKEVIVAESAALAVHDLSGQQDFNRRKSQSLLELTRIARATEGAALDTGAISRLAELREKLDFNHSVIGMHLRASQEVADIISNAIRNAESDGTYSAATCRMDDSR